MIPNKQPRLTKLSWIKRDRSISGCVPAVSVRLSLEVATMCAAFQRAIERETHSHFVLCPVLKRTYRSCDIAKHGLKRNLPQHVINSWRSVNQPSHRNHQQQPARPALKRGPSHLYAMDRVKIGAWGLPDVLNSGPNRSSITSGSIDPLKTRARVLTPARLPWCGKPRPPLGYSLRQMRQIRSY